MWDTWLISFGAVIMYIINGGLMALAIDRKRSFKTRIIIILIWPVYFFYLIVYVAVNLIWLVLTGEDY